ncbi:MAG: hypothetical protein ACWA5P_10260 [bacterium]
MIKQEVHIINKYAKRLVVLLLFVFFGFISSAQVSFTVDTTKIKIGEQINYQIQVEADSSKAVFFPEGQTFVPMELVEILPTDTLKETNRWLISKQYTLTQFDSGTYIIPQQKVLIDSKPFFTDSLKVEVATVVLDTTNLTLYDIKPIIEVDKSIGNWWRYLLLIIAILGLAAFLIYWFVWREKPLTEEEKVAQLPPYERAKKALVELDKMPYLENDEIKKYYSELTMIIRTYLDEKVYDRALESTTDQLIDRLQLLREANKIALDKETINNFKTIFKRADLVKFAKSKPDIELARIDRDTIDNEIDSVKESLPEPTEEEKLQDLIYKEEQEKKKKQRQIRMTIAAGVLALLIAIGAVVANLGVGYTIDKILGDDSLTLLEKEDWVTSDYGAPPITISTPVVLERQKMELSLEVEQLLDIAVFTYGGVDKPIDVVVSNTRYKPVADPNDPNAKPQTPKIDLAQQAESQLVELEKQGAQNIITKNEQFITPNGQEGLKTFGTTDFYIEEIDEKRKANYVILGFTTENILQQVILIWEQDNEYSQKVIDRIIGSIELLKLEDKDK